MKKYFLIVAISSCCFLQSFCQYNEARRVDSLKVDSLKNLLPGLIDSEKVDVLNQLSELFGSFYAVGGFTHRVDSMFYYAVEANKKAVKINYKLGEAKSLLALANSRLYRQQKDSLTKNYLQQAISLGREINNNSIIGSAYYLLAIIEDQATNYKKAIVYLSKSGDDKVAGEIYTWLCMVYTNKGEYEEALEYAEKSLELTKKNASTSWGYELVQWSLYNFSELYKAAGDYETAMDYIRQARQYGAKHDLDWNMDDQIGILLALMNKPDSSLYYLRSFKKNASQNQLGADMFIGETYLIMKKYDSARLLFQGVVDSLRRSKDPFLPFITKGLINLGKAYAGEKKYTIAFRYTKEGLSVIQNFNDPKFVMDVYKQLSDIYHHLKNNDSAYNYLIKYISLKDSIQNRQFMWKLGNYKKASENARKETQIILLSRDNKIKEQHLKQQTIFRDFLIAVFIAIIFAGLYVFRNISLKRKNEKLKQEQKEQEWKLEQLENEKRQAELQQQAAELEMQALRAQMNPHFIFNCLNSINRIILKNDSQAASDYLTRFSRLIRMVLVNSQLSMIPLEDELHMLRLYLDMERLRFKDAFNYSIIFTNAIEEESVMVPPLLLQPFCENAIWHGLMHLPADRQGHLTIELSMQDNVLQCIITDNGIGREASAALKSKSAEKQKSMGLTITAQRLALLNQNKKIQTFYSIEDVSDENNSVAGTRVVLKIAYKGPVEEMV